MSVYKIAALYVFIASVSICFGTQSAGGASGSGKYCSESDMTINEICPSACYSVAEDCVSNFYDNLNDFKNDIWKKCEYL